MHSLNQPINLDENIEQEFVNIINKLESQTGKLYQVILQENGTPINNDRVIKPFQNRSTFLIYDLLPEYADLAGTYHSYAEIENKLKLLYVYFAKSYKQHPDNPNTYIWECPSCSTYGDGEYSIYNSSGNSICQSEGCNFWVHSKYENVVVNLHNGLVFKSGGSISLCKTIGKVKIA